LQRGLDQDAVADASSDVPLVQEATADQVWRYTRSGYDDLSGQWVESAVVLSRNQLRLDGPFSGPQRAMLELRRHPRLGTDVIVSVERGQLRCGGTEPCRLKVRFNDAPREMWLFQEPLRGGTAALLVRDREDFLRRLRTSRTVEIELQFDAAVSHWLTFSTAGLQWQ
jgi:hypothetical protein